MKDCTAKITRHTHSLDTSGNNDIKLIYCTFTLKFLQNDTDYSFQESNTGSAFNTSLELKQHGVAWLGDLLAPAVRQTPWHFQGCPNHLNPLLSGRLILYPQVMRCDIHFLNCAFSIQAMVLRFQHQHFANVFPNLFVQTFSICRWVQLVT